MVKRAVAGEVGNMYTRRGLILSEGRCEWFFTTWEIGMRTYRVPGLEIGGYQVWVLVRHIVYSGVS